MRSSVVLALALRVGGEGKADLVQQRPQQPEPNADMHGTPSSVTRPVMSPSQV
jgi:hypothetical protein